MTPSRWSSSAMSLMPSLAGMLTTRSASSGPGDSKRFLPTTRPSPVTRATSRTIVMTALPTMTTGWRARRDGREGCDMRSGSSAARGLRGAIREAPEFPASGVSFKRIGLLFHQLRTAPRHRQFSLRRKQVRPKYGERATGTAAAKRAYQDASRRNTRDALVPPKPNELDKTTSMSRLCALCGTRSSGVSTDGLSRLMVGGATLSRMASTEKIASTAPAAPSRWPIDDLVDDIA